MNNEEDRAWRNPDLGLRHGRWSWCQVCERAHRTERVAANGWRCPTSGCAGRSINIFPWENRQFGPRTRHPEYPDEPVEHGWYRKW